MASEDIQRLNDLASNGEITASMTLFHLYNQGNENFGINRDVEVAHNYLDLINDHIQHNGLANLKPSLVYNLGYAEYYNLTDPDNRNISKALLYFRYAAERGEVSALNALGVIHVNGLYNPAKLNWDIRLNVSFAVELFNKAIELGNLEASSNLARLYLHGLSSIETGLVVL